MYGKFLRTIAGQIADGEIMATPVNIQHYEKGTHEVVITLPSKKNTELFYSITAEMASETVTERKKLK